MDRPEIILAPGPTPIPPEVLLAQGSPLVYHRGPGFGNIMREVTARLKELYRTDDRRRAADDVERHRRPRVGDRELLLARRRGARAGGGVLRRAVQGARRDVRAHGAHGRLRVGRAHPARRGRGGARRAPGQGRAAHAVRDVDRRDPADRAAREGGERRRRDGGRRRRLVARRRAVRVRRVGHRRRGRAARRRRSAPRPASRSSRSATAPGRPRAPPRTRASTSTGRPTSASPTCRTRRTRGPPRSA